MNAIRTKLAIGAVAALSLMTLAAQPSYARATDQGGQRTEMIDRGDRLAGKDVQAASSPVSGQPSVTINETLHYVNEPFWGWKHNTAYTMQRAMTATYVDRLGYYVLHDSEGDWYAFSPGSAAANKLPGKPQASLGAQARVLDSNDGGSLASVTAGSVIGGTPQLNVTYNYTHVEALDDVSYSTTSAIGTTFVGEQNAWYAWVSNHLYSVNTAGQVSALNDKPYVDRGAQNGLLGSDDSHGAYPGVVSTGGVFLVTWNYQHEDTFEHVRYTVQQQVRPDYVSEVNKYMAWIDGTEYQASPGFSVVERLSDRPVVDMGALNNPVPGDRSFRTDVFNVTNTNVVVRFFYHHNEAYVAKDYYVERVGVMYYDQNYSVWMVALDGSSYAIAWDSDSVNDSSVTVLRAPAGSTRPEYVVPSNTGDGMPAAVVPGREEGRRDVAPPPPPAYNGGIPGRAPSGIPGRAPAAGNCIPGRC
jgi:hypothetical protein